MPWLTKRTPQGDVHVRPTADLIPHPPSDDCVCGPTPEACERPDGSIGWLYIHHSLDGRELAERTDHTNPANR